jgi:hypothetical protein
MMFQWGNGGSVKVSAASRAMAQNLVAAAVAAAEDVPGPTGGELSINPPPPPRPPLAGFHRQGGGRHAALPQQGLRGSR